MRGVVMSTCGVRLAYRLIIHLAPAQWVVYVAGISSAELDWDVASRETTSTR
jgi:hypothetical protein